MDSIIPIGIVLYVVASIVGAILKQLANQPSGEKSEGKSLEQTLQERVEELRQRKLNRPEVVIDPSNQPSPVFFEEQQELAEVDHSSLQGISTEQAESPAVDLPDEAEWEGFEELKVAPNRKPLAPAVKVKTLGRKELVQGIVLSEILREPRAKRRWPSR